jgi:hypothetical protein
MYRAPGMETYRMLELAINPYMSPCRGSSDKQVGLSRLGEKGGDGAAGHEAAGLGGVA